MRPTKKTSPVVKKQKNLEAILLDEEEKIEILL